MTGLDDVLMPAGLLNLLGLLAAIGVWYWRRPEGALNLVLLVLIGGQAFHLVTDLVADLGEVGEHYLLHLILLATALAAALR